MKDTRRCDHAGGAALSEEERRASDTRPGTLSQSGNPPPGESAGKRELISPGAGQAEAQTTGSSDAGSDPELSAERKSDRGGRAGKVDVYTAVEDPRLARAS